MHGRRNTIAVRPTRRTGLANSTSPLAAMGVLAEPTAQSRLVLVCFGSGREPAATDSRLSAAVRYAPASSINALKRAT